MATWTAILSPAKPSDGKLAVELPVELAYRDAVGPRAEQRHSMIRDLLANDPLAAALLRGDADPFAGDEDPFGDVDSMLDLGAVQQHKITLRDAAGRVVVSELPAAGKPPGFSGAVGQFQIAIDPPSGELRVGEPAAVTIRVTGAGDFDRVAVPAIAGTQELETFAGKTSFLPAAAGSLTGTKTFVETIVPRRAGPLARPALTLAYFDPVKRAYASADTLPVTLAIAKAPGGGASDPRLATASVRDPAMTANRVEPGATHRTLAPVFRQQRFWGLAGALVVLTLVLVGLARWRRDPRIARVRGARRFDRAIARRRSAMDQAARRDHPIAFFTSARQALQARLGALWQMAPEAITAADVDARLGERGSAIRGVFEHADQMTYAAALADDHRSNRGTRWSATSSLAWRSHHDPQSASAPSIRGNRDHRGPGARRADQRRVRCRQRRGRSRRPCGRGGGV